MSTPRVAVIGTGYWGQNLLRSFHQMGALRAICDSNDECLRGRATLYPSARAYRDADALLADGDIDAVAIATPAATHGTLVRRGLEANKHVFVEKPLCLDLREGRELRALAAAKSLRLMVGHLLLYHPAFISLRDVVARGELGELRYIYSHRLNLGRIRREENALWSFAPHDISMILALTCRMPSRATTSGGAYLSPTVADTTLTHLDFGSGLQAHIFVSWLHPYKEHRLVVIGSKGMVVFADSTPGRDKLLFYPHDVAWQGDLPVVEKAVARQISYADEEPLIRECRHFLECITSGKEPLSDSAEALRVLTVLDACQRGLTTNSPQELWRGP